MPLELIKDSKESGLTLYSAYVGEICSKCGETRMLHPELYVYTCPYCRFSFRVNPVNRKKPITILNKGGKK